MNPKYIRRELYEEDYVFNEQEYKGKSHYKKLNVRIIYNSFRIPCSQN